MITAPTRPLGRRTIRLVSIVLLGVPSIVVPFSPRPVSAAGRAIAASSPTVGTPVSSGVTFSTATDYATNGRSDQIAQGDFNKDGKLDVVTTTQSGTISVLLGHGDGTFAPAVTYATNGVPQALAVGDITGNGILDIVTANPSPGDVSIFMGHGDGTFAPAVNYPAYSQPYGIALGDFNGDHKLDIVTGNQITGDISVLLNRGDGTFQASINTPAGHGPDARGVGVGDFNGDGKLDVAVANGYPRGAEAATISVLLGNGDGTFGSPHVMGVGNTYQTANYVMVADLNHDGKLDVVGVTTGCGYGGSDATIFLGNGDGTFQTGQSLGEGCLSYVTAADINGDGNLDLVTVNGDSPYDDNSYIHVHLGNGDGTFQSAISFSVSPGRAAFSEVLLDLNHDGKPDVVTANLTTNDVSVLMNHSTLPHTGGFVPLGVPVSPPDTYGNQALSCGCGVNAVSFGKAGHPINTATGNFAESMTDLSVPGRGIPAHFTRTYNSLAASTNGPLGYGWTFNAGASLHQDAGTGNVTVSQENGSEVPFVKSGTTFTPAAPRFIATLTQNPDGSFIFTRFAQQRLTFSAAGKVASESDLNGYTTSFMYNASAQIAAITEPSGRSLTLGYTGSQLTSVTDPIGRHVTFGYNDGAGNLTDVTDVGGSGTHFTYDAAHHLTAIRDPRGNTVTNTYDVSGRAVAQADQLGRTTTLAYAADGSSTTITDPKGNVTVEQYQSGVRTAVTKGSGTPQAATWTFTYDPATLGVTTASDPNGHVTTITYDASGNLLTSTDPLGRQTVNTYDVLNDLTTVTDPKHVATTMTYDTSGNLQSRSRPLLGTVPPQTQLTTYRYGDATHPGDVTAMVDPDGHVASSTYDGAGNQTAMVDPAGDKTTSTFNGVGWVLSSVAPRGYSPHSNPGNFRTTFSHNAFGDVLVAKDPLGHTTKRNYDANRNVDRLTDGDGKVTTYTYDAANELTTTTRADGTVTTTAYNADRTVLYQRDGKGNATTYGYDPLGRKVSVTDPLGRATSFTYDAGGNLQTTTDPQTPPQTATQTYDAANELTGTTYSDGHTPNVTNITYDNNGQRTSMTDGTGTSAWTYDSLNRLTSSLNGVGATVGYGYDLNGQLTSLVYPGNNVVNEGYDPAGRLHSVTDWLGQTTTWGYDANSNLTREAFPAAAGTDRFTFDRADRVTTIADSQGTNPPFATFTYGRDGNGQLTSQKSTGVAQPPETYGYTALNQLGKVNASANAYTYDPADNVTHLAVGTALSYDAANELQGSTAAGSSTAYGYDAMGNRTAVTPSAGPSTTATYDQANRLTAFGADATYSYNGDGLRTAKTAAGTATPFVWDVHGGLPLLLQEGSTSYIYGPGGLPLEQITGTAVSYYHHDQLGSTRALTDASGKVQSTYTYDPYGNLLASTGTATNPLRFCGEYQDAESGLYYLRARYYDPATAQFLTRDPLVSVTMSPYAYVAGNPLNATDPNGLCWGPGCWVQQQLNSHGLCTINQDNCGVSLIASAPAVAAAGQWVYRNEPDYVTASVGTGIPIPGGPALNIGWQLALSKDFHLYTGPHIGVGTSGPSAFLGLGIIDPGGGPISECERDQFIRGAGASLHGQVPVYGPFGPGGSIVNGRPGESVRHGWGVEGGVGVGQNGSVTYSYNYQVF